MRSDNAKSGMQQAPAPVSYTHLDVYKRQGYNRGLESRGLLDFDDMLVMCYQLFDQRKDILAAWQSRYRFILIDEMCIRDRPTALRI